MFSVFFVSSVCLLVFEGRYDGKEMSTLPRLFDARSSVLQNTKQTRSKKKGTKKTELINRRAPPRALVFVSKVGIVTILSVAADSLWCTRRNGGRQRKQHV